VHKPNNKGYALGSYCRRSNAIRYHLVIIIPRGLRYAVSEALVALLNRYRIGVDKLWKVC